MVSFLFSPNPLLALMFWQYRFCDDVKIILDKLEGSFLALAECQHMLESGCMDENFEKSFAEAKAQARDPFLGYQKNYQNQKTGVHLCFQRQLVEWMRFYFVTQFFL